MPTLDELFDGSESMLAGAKWLRKISPRRARKLRKRGECVHWSIELCSYVWEPDWHTYNRKTENGLPWIGHKEYLAQIKA